MGICTWSESQDYLISSGSVPQRLLAGPYTNHGFSGLARGLRVLFQKPWVQFLALKHKVPVTPVPENPTPSDHDTAPAYA